MVSGEIPNKMEGVSSGKASCSKINTRDKTNNADWRKSKRLQQGEEERRHITEKECEQRRHLSGGGRELWKWGWRGEAGVDEESDR